MVGIAAANLKMIKRKEAILLAGLRRWKPTQLKSKREAKRRMLRRG